MRCATAVCSVRRRSRASRPRSTAGARIGPGSGRSSSCPNGCAPSPAGRRRSPDDGMKVLLLSTRYFGLGGAEAYTRLLVRAAAESGAQVDILSLLGGSAENGRGGGRYLGDLGDRSTRWTHARFLARALRRGRGYQLVICAHVAVAPVGLMLSRVFRVPYLVVGYGIDVWGPLGALRRTALRRAAEVIVISRFTGGMVTAVHGVPSERIQIIHPAVDPALLALAPPAGGPEHTRNGEPLMLLTVARLSARE